MIKATYNSETKMLAVTDDKGETREFPAILIGVDGSCAMSSCVFGVRYPTGAKVWPASVSLWTKTGRLVVEAGGYDRGGRSAGAINIVGWFSDVRDANKSQVSGR